MKRSLQSAEDSKKYLVDNVEDTFDSVLTHAIDDVCNYVGYAPIEAKDHIPREFIVRFDKEKQKLYITYNENNLLIFRNEIDINRALGFDKLKAMLVDFLKSFVINTDLNKIHNKKYQKSKLSLLEGNDVFNF